MDNLSHYEWIIFFAVSITHIFATFKQNFDLLESLWLFAFQFAQDVVKFSGYKIHSFRKPTVEIISSFRRAHGHVGFGPSATNVTVKMNFSTIYAYKRWKTHL